MKNFDKLERLIWENSCEMVYQNLVGRMLGNTLKSSSNTNLSNLKGKKKLTIF